VNIDERTIGKSLLILCVVRGCYLEAILDDFCNWGRGQGRRAKSIPPALSQDDSLPKMMGLLREQFRGLWLSMAVVVAKHATDPGGDMAKGWLHST
jgi:hypothetical protein